MAVIRVKIKTFTVPLKRTFPRFICIVVDTATTVDLETEMARYSVVIRNCYGYDYVFSISKLSSMMIPRDFRYLLRFAWFLHLRQSLRLRAPLKLWRRRLKPVPTGHPGGLRRHADVRQSRRPEENSAFVCNLLSWYYNL